MWGVCPPLAHLVGETAETRYGPLVESNARTGRELMVMWEGMVREVREGTAYLGRELEEGPFSVPVAGVGEGSTYAIGPMGPPGSSWSGPGRS